MTIALYVLVAALGLWVWQLQRLRNYQRDHLKALDRITAAHQDHLNESTKGQELLRRLITMQARHG